MEILASFPEMTKDIKKITYVFTRNDEYSVEINKYGFHYPGNLAENTVSLAMKNNNSFKNADFENIKKREL